jgi:hypothetical protein
MTKFYIYLFLFLCSLATLFFYEPYLKNSSYANEVWTIIWAGLSASIGALIAFILENKSSILLSIRCFLFKRNSDVYVSLSYLIRIKLKGSNKYLMVRGNKIKNQFQPVGGVYKQFPSLVSKWQEWEALEAKNNPEDSDDLRFTTKRKYIPEIRKWFYKRKNRETDVWREFCEELISTKVLPQKDFAHIKPEFLYSKEEQLIFRKGKNIKQFLIYDIFTANLTPKQESIISNLLEESVLSDKYAFVEENDLDKELFTINNQEYQLGFHARYLKSKSC